MKKVFLPSAILLLVIFSCKENENKIVEHAADNTQSSFPVKRLRYTQNILDGIYKEQMKNNADLQKLDKKINTLQEDSRKMKDLYKEIINNSEEYYEVAKNDAKGINDSVLRKEIILLIESSSLKYETKKKTIKDLTTKINLNYYKIFSFYNAFKIRKTLPEIENYQNSHPLETDSLENFINKQNQLLNELKNLK